MCVRLLLCYYYFRNDESSVQQQVWAIAQPTMPLTGEVAGRQGSAQIVQGVQQIESSRKKQAIDRA